jgi:hypothetical protein
MKRFHQVRSVPSFLCAVLTTLLLVVLAGCFGPTNDAGATVSMLDGGVTFSLPDGWKETQLPDRSEDEEASVFSAVFAYQDAGGTPASDGREWPAVYVEISCTELSDDGAHYLKEAGANYEMVHASFPESGQFVWKNFGSTKGYYGMFYDTGDDGFLGPWATTYLKSSSGKDIIVHVQFQVQKDWYEGNEAMIEQIVDSLRLHPPYAGDVTQLGNR